MKHLNFIFNLPVDLCEVYMTDEIKSNFYIYFKLIFPWEYKLPPISPSQCHHYTTIKKVCINTSQ